MALVLFDNRFRTDLYPFTCTRPVADLRAGIYTPRERWALLSGLPVTVHTEPYLRNTNEHFGPGDNTWIDAAVIPDGDLVTEILSLEPGHCLADDDGLIAGRSTIAFEDFSAEQSLAGFQTIRDHANVKRIRHPWDLMLQNDAFIRHDFVLASKGRMSQPVDESVRLIDPAQVFIEPGATLQHCVLNASSGPIYIGHNAEIMEGCSIRGPFVLGDNSVLKMNSRIYGATTLGPNCMGGGEIKNSVMMAYSNKAHDGYLGDSVVGEWCNFGAGTSNSNVKNTAGTVKVWSMGRKEYLPVGQKCGLIMGDYSRAAINSSINTGSMIGVSCNVFGEGLLPTLIENFAWGAKRTAYEFPKALEAIANWKKMKDKTLNEREIAILRFIFENIK